MPYLKWPVQCSFSGPDSPGLALARCGGEPALSLRLLIPHTLVQETAPWAPDASSSFLEDFRFVALRPKRGCRISWLAARGARLTICVIEVGTYCVHYLLPRSLEIGKLFFPRASDTGSHRCPPRPCPKRCHADVCEQRSRASSSHSHERFPSGDWLLLGLWHASVSLSLSLP